MTLIQYAPMGRLLSLVPQASMLAALVAKPEFRRDGLIASARKVFGPTGMRISFLMIFLLTVILATPMLIRGFRDFSVVGLSWIGTISACILYSFLFGIPMSIQAVLIMIVASMFASGIAIAMQIKKP